MSTVVGSSRAASSWQARLPFFFGWAIVLIAHMRSFASAGTNWSLSVMVAPMKGELGWSRSSIYAGMTLSNIFGAVGGTLLGRLLDRKRGAPALALLSGLVIATTLFLVSGVQTRWQFWLLFGVFSGLLGAGPGLLLTSAIVPKWFVRRRGLATAMASMGSGNAAMVLPPLVTWVISRYGWRGTWQFLGVLTIILAVLPALLVRRQPEDVGLRPDGDAVLAPARPIRVEMRSFTPREAFRSRTMWLLVAATVFATFSPLAYPTNLVPIYLEKGFSPATAAWAFSGYGFASFFGRFFWGPLADRLHIRTVLIIIGVYTGLAIPLLLVLPGKVALISGAMAGFGIGGWVGVGQLVWANYFGRDNLGAITGLVRPFNTLSGATGPLLVAFLADVVGGYWLSIVLMSFTWWACVLLLYTAKPKTQAIGRV